MSLDSETKEQQLLQDRWERHLKAEAVITHEDARIWAAGFLHSDPPQIFWSIEVKNDLVEIIETISSPFFAWRVRQAIFEALDKFTFSLPTGLPVKGMPDFKEVRIPLAGKQDAVRLRYKVEGNRLTLLRIWLCAGMMRS